MASESRYQENYHFATSHPEAVAREIARLDDEITTLRAENEKLKMANERLVEQNNSLVRKCDPNLSSADLKAVDRHCDWVAFGHAYRAMLNSRAALGEQP